MKFTFAWLKEHLDTEASLDEIRRSLTMIGLEVEGVEDRGAEFAAFTVAEVVSCEPHPSADRLRVCLVDTGRERVQVVCGAPNARAGMKGVFAPVGVTVPGSGLVLKATTIRGVESNGMLLSQRELGLSNEHEGIIDLPATAPIGAPFARVMGLDDPVIDVALTPNRGDCASVRGIARDLAAAGFGTLKGVPGWQAPTGGGFPSPIGVKLDFAPGAAAASPLYGGRYFRGLKNGPSPAWLQERLKAVGLRPISALVDVTNYFTLDMGRPLHVFDADKVTGDIVVRLSRPGEAMDALDGRRYEFDAAMTLITDASGPVGLGGVMGGTATGCTAETVNMFLECALFDPLRTARTGRRLAIQSDARYRFERGVDPTSVLPGLEAATRMILTLCGGEASDVVIAGREPDWHRTIAYRPHRMASLGGVDVPVEDSRRILHDLGFKVGEGMRLASEGAALRVEPPPWRPDIEGEADLVEEVLRIHGYDRIPVLPLPRLASMPGPALSTAQARPVKARRALAARGLVEAVTYSFMPSAAAAHFGGAKPELALANPISADLDAMRPSILPNLIAAAGRNADRGFADQGLFEVGPQFESESIDGQRLMAAGIRRGRSGPRHWAATARPVDAYDARADAMAALAACGAPVDNLRVTADAPAWYHPGRSGALRLGPTPLGYFGELNPGVLAALGLDGPMIGFEAFLDAVPEPKARPGKAKSLLKPSPFQAVERDFAFVLDEDVTAEAVLRAASGADRALIATVSVFDVYAGERLGEAKKSLAIAVTLQPIDRTLTEADIEAAAKKIVAAVTKATGGVLRT